MILVVAAFSDPIGKPLQLMFRVAMLAAACVFGAFAWGLYQEPHQTTRPDEQPTVAGNRRRVKRTRIGRKRYPDGTTESMFETHEEIEE